MVHLTTFILRGKNANPITVVNDDGVSCSEIDTEATSPGREQKSKDAWVFVELRNAFHTVRNFGAAIQAAVVVRSHQHEVLDKVQHSPPLWENQNLERQIKF